MDDGGGVIENTPAGKVISTLVPAEIWIFLDARGLTDRVITLANEDVQHYPDPNRESTIRARTKATIASVIIQESEHVTSDQDKEDFKHIRELVFADIRNDMHEESEAWKTKER